MLRDAKAPNLHKELFYRHAANPILTIQTRQLLCR